MANTLNLSAGVNGSINGLNVNQSSQTALAPTGSTIFAESVLINTSSYQQVFTGSVGQPIGVIYFANTSPTGSISVAVSASGVVSNLGSVGPSNGINSSGTVIQWNGPITAIYAEALTTQSFGVFVIAAQ